MMQIRQNLDQFSEEQRLLTKSLTWGRNTKLWYTPSRRAQPLATGFPRREHASSVASVESDSL